MSRGLGRLERAIVATIERQRQAHREVRVTVGDIVGNAYPHRWVKGDFVDPDPSPRAHLVAAHRAMHSFVRKHPEFGLIGGKGGWPLELVSVSAARRWASLWREEPVDRQRSTATRRNRKRRA
jgi:hypothetical protein